MTAILAFVPLLCLICFSQIVASEELHERPGVSPAEIFRTRGFLAREDYVVSEGGYVLRVTRATNPLINSGKVASLPNRDPILFIHGITENDGVFVIRSQKIKPRDFSQLDLNSSDPSVNKTILKDPSSKNLVFLALNFGHTVYILSRRGYIGSQERVGDPNSINPRNFRPLPKLGHLSVLGNPYITASRYFKRLNHSFNRNYWNFSFDEQIMYDFPKVVDFVLNQTGRKKLTLLAHSCGSMLSLGALSIYPELEDKINGHIHWGGTMNVGHGDTFTALLPYDGFFHEYIGPLLPDSIQDLMQASIAALCRRRTLIQKTICKVLPDIILGASGSREPYEIELLQIIISPFASHEIYQNLQSVRMNGMLHMYDWGSEGNMELYNNTLPPLYDISKLKSNKLSFWSSITDFIVTNADTEATIKMIKVPVKYHLIKQTFNHQGYFYHEQNNEIVVLPTMKEIHMFSAMP